MANILNNFKYYFVVCEGTSESNIISWGRSENYFFTDISKINFEYQISGRREKGKSCLVESISSTNYGNEVAILYVHDSKNEEFFGKKNKAYNLLKKVGLNIHVINVLTCPEIEMLLIVKEPILNRAWLGNKSQLKPSELCNQFYKTNVKRESFLVDQFKSIDELVSVCKKYKESCKKSKSPNDITLFDILKSK